MGPASDGSAGSITEVEFRTHDDAIPFVAASGRANCRIELAEIVPRSEQRYGEFFEVLGASPSVLASAGETFDDVGVTVHRRRNGAGLVEFVVGGTCPAVTLAHLDALPRVVRGVDGRGRVVAEVPAGTKKQPVIDAFLEDFPTFELAATRPKDAIEPPFSRASFRRLAEEELTDRQREVLLTAYEAGYYDWPRGCTGDEVAATLDISSATFSQHVHAAERKLLSLLFDHRLSDEAWSGDVDDDRSDPAR